MLVSAIHTARLELVAIDPTAIRYLIEGDRKAAEQVMGVTLPEEFPTEDDLAGFLQIQLHRMEKSPNRRAWMARLMLSNTKEAIGHCGFHGPPEEIGRAEIGYTVFKKFRGQGHAKEAAHALIQWAFEQGEPQVFASGVRSTSNETARARSTNAAAAGGRYRSRCQMRTRTRGGTGSAS